DPRRMYEVRIGRIKNPGVVIFAVEGGDIVFADRAPVRLARADVCPALNACKQSLDARAIAADRESGHRRMVFVLLAVVPENGHQALRAANDDAVMLVNVALWGKTSLGVLDV